MADDAADVLIVGSGASGGAVAWRLASAGIKVVCLEQGNWLDPARIPSNQPDWEFRRLTDWNPNPNVRRGPADYPIVDAASPIKPLLYNGVGGSTIMWSTMHPRFHPSDFRVRTLDGVGDDWPLTYDELAPYYDLNDRMMGVSGLAGDTAYPPRPARPFGPLGLTGGGRTLAEAMDRLGWHWWPAERSQISAPSGDRQACNNCGWCEAGCPRRAKGSTDVTYWPAALAAGAVLKTGARVFEITVDDQGRATGAHYFDASGNIRHKAADKVVMAANGIGTPRLLLLSVSKLFPDGLANSSGLVGRNLMFHPIANVTGVFDTMINGHTGNSTVSLYCQQFYETDPTRGFARGFMMAGLRSQGPMVTATGGWAKPLAWGESHHRDFMALAGRTGSISILCEDLPDERNHVGIDASVCDAWGIPSASLHYQIDQNSERMLAYGMARAREALVEAGARDVVDKALLSEAGFHLMGTAKMGSDPARSVTDRWGRSHDVPNLYIVDGSLFVTSAAVNPTPTIQALALRIADHLIASRGAGG